MEQGLDTGKSYNLLKIVQQLLEIVKKVVRWFTLCPDLISFQVSFYLFKRAYTANFDFPDTTSKGVFKILGVDGILCSDSFFLRLLTIPKNLPLDHLTKYCRTNRRVWRCQ
jgi:hypothetical protein